MTIPKDYNPTKNHISIGTEIGDNGQGDLEIRNYIKSAPTVASEQSIDNVLNEDGQLYDHDAAPSIVSLFLGWFW